MFLPQVVCVVGTCLAGRQIAFGQRLDTVQGLEVFKRLCHTSVRRLRLCVIPFLLRRLVRLDEQPARVRHAAEVHCLFQRAPRTVSVAYQHAAVVAEEFLRMLLASPWLVLEQHHGFGAVFGAAIDPRIAFTLRRPAGFLEYLKRGLVAVDQRLRQQCPVQRVVQAGVVQFAGADDPVCQRAPAHRNLPAGHGGLHPVQRHAVDVFRGRHRRDHRRIRMAARKWLYRHRCEHDRRLFGVTLAVPARVLCTHVLVNRPFDLDMQLFADVLADTMHRIATTRATSLLLRQIVLDAFALQVRRQRLASHLAPLRLAGRWQAGVRQRRLDTFVVPVAWFGPGDLLSFVEHAILAFFTFRRVTLGRKQSDLFLELPDAPVQFVDVFRIAGYARFEGVDIALDSLGYALEVGCILHALQDSEARRPVGLRQFVTGAHFVRIPLFTCDVRG